MSDALIIEYNPFDIESKVAIFKDGKQEYIRVFSSIEELTTGIIRIAYNNSIYDIKVSGPLAVTGEIRKQITENEKSMYSQNKITVEGI